jgi:hypothetical protein
VPRDSRCATELGYRMNYSGSNDGHVLQADRLVTGFLDE